MGGFAANKCGFPALSDAAARLAVLAAALVSPQPLFDAQRRLIGAFIRVGRLPLGLDRGAGIQVQHAFGAETEAVLAHGGEARMPASEIFRRRLFDAIADPFLQRQPDADVFSGNPQRHAISSLLSAACETAPTQCRGPRSPAKAVRALVREARAFPTPCEGEKFRTARRSAAATLCSRRLLLAPPLHRGRDAHRFAVFGDGAARNVDAGGF